MIIVTAIIGTVIFCIKKNIYLGEIIFLPDKKIVYTYIYISIYLYIGRAEVLADIPPVWKKRKIRGRERDRETRGKE